MGAKLVTWRRGDAASAEPLALPAASRSETIELAPGMPSPFLFDVPEGGRQLSLETRLYRAPLFEHPPQPTDFLLIRTHCGKWKLRRVTSTAVAGHEEPFPEGAVPAPGSPEAQELLTGRIRAHVERDLLRRARQKEQPEVSLRDLSNVFTGVGVDAIRGAINAFMTTERGDRDRAILRAGWDIDRNEMLQRFTPEMVCAFESHQATLKRMYSLGIDRADRFVNPKNSLQAAVKALQGKRDVDPAAKQAAQVVQLEVQLAPWAQTRVFLEAMNPENKAFLWLDSGKDGGGLRRRGFLFHYEKKSSKKQDKDKAGSGGPKAGQKITGTDSDLRKLRNHETHAILKGFGLTDQEIKALTRWKRIDVIRTLNAAAAADGRIAQKKWLRDARETQAQAAQNQRRAADALYARMVRACFVCRDDARVHALIPLYSRNPKTLPVLAFLCCWCESYPALSTLL